VKTGNKQRNGLRNIKQLSLILTSRCNLDCRYCYQNAKKNLSIRWETVRTALDIILDSRHRSVLVSFLGGEPLLEFGMIRRAVDYAEENLPEGKSLSFGISTNGTLITEGIADFLSGKRFDTQLSFDGPVEAQDFRGRGSFAVLDSLLEELRKKHPGFFRRNLKIVMTLTPFTIPYLSDSVDYFINKGAGVISISPVITHDPAWRDDGIEELENQFELILERSLSHLEETGEIPLRLFQDKHGDSESFRENRDMCGAASGLGLVVDVDGRGCGCSVFAESYQRYDSPFAGKCMSALKMGKITDPSFAARFSDFPSAARKLGIFHHKENKRSSYQRCADCRYYSQCAVCPASIIHIPGNSDPDRVSDFVCAFNMASLKRRQLFPARPDPVRMILEGPEAAETDIEKWRRLSEANKKNRRR